MFLPDAEMAKGVYESWEQQFGGFSCVKYQIYTSFAEISPSLLLSAGLEGVRKEKQPLNGLGCAWHKSLKQWGELVLPVWDQTGSRRDISISHS